MMSYVSVGTNDLERALCFYDSLFELLGGNRVFESPTGQFYGFSEGSLFCVLKPADGKIATNGNGTMFAFKIDSPEKVSEAYARALELGATDEGEPGPRGDQGFFGSYVRDLDGNKLCIYHM
ncbi:MAG: glyoxalase [SAR86 cluster bacterium]|uniref:Glyoxalase n=1 Tax=SAR86 cluster bacterium TaxID=2030880 RepID=A0A2A4WV40_9GAMM|nr:MAG: glyoxalase [SAR86 cluster bacterium]